MLIQISIVGFKLIEFILVHSPRVTNLYLICVSESHFKNKH